MIEVTLQAAPAAPPGGPAHYRPDIDGLRAVAVVAVILFHFGVWPFTGGFVGVDVFFVISGYLITTIVLAEIAAGRFSIVQFYERRLRRIAPALLLVVLVSTVVSLFVFLPGDLRPVGTSLLNAALYTSNILFHSVANDYFAAEDLGVTPVLHTWSLSVEAQFYLVYPWLLLGLGRWPGRLRIGLGALAALSFAGAAWGAIHAPTAAFYLLPWRAWELLLGAALAFRPPRGAVPRWVAEGMAVAGLMAIGVAIFSFSRATPFPGAAALLPCVGAALVIRAGATSLRPLEGEGVVRSATDEGGFDRGFPRHLASPRLAPSTLLRKVPLSHAMGEDTRGRLTRALSWRPLVFLGRISYSLYLWHWPILVFASYGRSAPLGGGATILLIGASVVLAAASWRWVERPFLSRALLPRRNRLFAGAAFATAVVAGAAGLTELAGHYGFAPNTLSPEVTALAKGQYDSIGGDCRPGDLAAATAPPCRFGVPGQAPSVVLWGNSYARVFTPTLDLDARAHGAAGVSLLLSKCLPLLGVAFADLPDCAAFNTAAIAYIAAHRELHTVVIAANWFIGGDRLRHLADDIETLTALGRNIVVLLAPPQPGFSVPRTLALAALRHEPPPPPIDLAKARARQRDSLDVIEALRRTYGFAVIDPADALCDGSTCPLERDGHPVFFDDGHLSVSAAHRAAGLFATVFGP